MAPTVDSASSEKKKSGIRRLFVPFSSSHPSDSSGKRKSAQSSAASTPTATLEREKKQTVVETAFISGRNGALLGGRRCKSVSPNRRSGIPDTSLVLEERKEQLLRGLSVDTGSNSVGRSGRLSAPPLQSGGGSSPLYHHSSATTGGRPSSTDRLLMTAPSPPRPRSVSPAYYMPSPNGRRGTSSLPRQSIIYEEVVYENQRAARQHQLHHQQRRQQQLQQQQQQDKRVSFSPEPPLCWPARPLPPLPPSSTPVTARLYANITSGGHHHLRSPSPHHHQHVSDTDSEAGEIQRILLHRGSSPAHSRRLSEEEWSGDGKSRGSSDQSGGGREEEGRRGGRGRREDPRRHTLAATNSQGSPAQPPLYPPPSSQLARSMDLESPLPKSYPGPSNPMLLDDDPGIMSEVETSSTGFRRGNKQRSSLPVVRTPSKTLERPLGLVFLQYRSETKRALLPNEITSIDTVKALFVRSFPKQLTMEYMDSPHVKIYIHDSSKDMFYELEDLRSHLRDIRDRSVLRLFESSDVAGGGLTVPTWDQDQSYFSEPEFDSEYQHQHIHKTKGVVYPPPPPVRFSRCGSERLLNLENSLIVNQQINKGSKSHQQGGPPYYMTHSFPPGGGTLGGRSGGVVRGGGGAGGGGTPVVPPPYKGAAPDGYMSSPERGGVRSVGGGAPPPQLGYPPASAYSPAAAAASYHDDPYYAPQYPTAAPRPGTITPVIDEEARIRVEHMERQLASLTGLVHKALTQQQVSTVQVVGGTAARTPPDIHHPPVPPSSVATTPSATPPYRTNSDKSVSFEKSVSFSDEPPDMNSPKQHSPQHGVDTKPTKPAIKSSTLPRMSSQDRDRHKPTPPPKPVSLSPGQYESRNVYRDLQLTAEMYNQLRGLQKKAKDLRQEVRNLRRMSQTQAHSVRETIRDTFLKIRAMLIAGGEGVWSAGGDEARLRVCREGDLYRQQMLRLESDLTELEGTVEELRGNVINRKTRVNMSDVENMALVLSKSSKTVAELKLKFPSLQESIKSLISQEMEKVVTEEKFLKEEPEKLESALRRCKKLTGTLVTLKRLASVQEQRLPDSRLSPTLDESPAPVTPTSGKCLKVGVRTGV